MKKKKVLEKWLNGIPYKVRRFWMFCIFDILLITIFASVFFSLAFWDRAFYSSVFVKYLPPFFDTLIIIGVLIVGTLLYAFRCRNLFRYGMLELAAGLVIAIYAVNMLLGKVTPGAATLFSMLGTLYVIVRGYDNI